MEAFITLPQLNMLTEANREKDRYYFFEVILGSRCNLSMSLTKKKHGQNIELQIRQGVGPLKKNIKHSG